MKVADECVTVLAAYQNKSSVSFQFSTPDISHMKKSKILQKYTKAASFILCVYVKFDILFVAFTGFEPVLRHHISGQIESQNGACENAMGCEHWVIGLISTVSDLRRWKEDQKQKQELDITLLVSKGASIEHQLQDRLQQCQDRLVEATSGDQNHIRVLEITNIYALSALTYLHVVTLGAYPKLLQITASVSRTIIALQGLSIPETLLLSWPICVTGCMALNEQYAAIGALISTWDDHWRVQSRLRKILDECWSRRAAGEACDWISATDQLGCHI